MLLITPNINPNNVPYNMILPVNLNILAPIPFINPSDLLSIALLVIVFANPVLGTINPHLQKLNILSNIPIPVNNDPININVENNKVTFDDIKYELLYTYCTSNYKNFKQFTTNIVIKSK